MKEFTYVLTNGVETKTSTSKYSNRTLRNFKSNNHPSQFSRWVDDNFENIAMFIVLPTEQYNVVKSA
jgi:hypothetical protein